MERTNKVQHDNDRITVLARDLHGFLEVKVISQHGSGVCANMDLRKQKDFISIFGRKYRRIDRLLIIRLLLKWRKKSL